MALALTQGFPDFVTYPPIGGQDWRYTYQTARVRALELQMLSRATLLDMAHASTYEQVMELLANSEYAVQYPLLFQNVEQHLQDRRTAIRALFADFIRNQTYVELFRTRDDFANLRLALRRVLTGKAVGTDYSPDGTLSPEQMAGVFADQDPFSGPVFPQYITRTVEEAVLAYYQDKDVTRVDAVVDRRQMSTCLQYAWKLRSPFLVGLFRMQADLANIRTMLRIKFTKAEHRQVFLEGGYIDIERFTHGLDLGLEALGPLFFVTPYHRIVDSGAHYLVTQGSFIRVEQLCDDYIAGYLNTTITIASGPQPIIAYLLAKEQEIRQVRLIVTARKNHLDTRMVLDRLGA